MGLWHSGGARLAEGVEALHAVGLVFEAMVRASGLIPQISVVLGFAAGGAAYGPALTDVVIMAPEGRVFVTGPDVVRSVTGEQVDMVSLGGPDTHTKKSGVAHIAAHDEADALHRARRLVSMMWRAGRIRSAGSGTRRQRSARHDACLRETCIRRSSDRSRNARQRRRRVEFRRTARQLRSEHRHRFRPDGRTHRWRHREQPTATRGVPELRKCREGRSIRATVQRIRRTARSRRGCSGLPAGRVDGVGRRCPPRSEAASRLRRGDCPPASPSSLERSTAAHTSR